MNNKNNEQQTPIEIAKHMAALQEGLGFIVTALFGFWTFAAITSKDSMFANVESRVTNIVVAAFLLIIGIIILYNGISTTILIRKFCVYTVKFVNMPGKEKDLSEVALAYGRPVEKILSDLNKMIKREYFQNVALDFTEQTLTFIYPDEDHISEKLMGPEDEGKELIMCPGCGMIHKIDKKNIKNCANCGADLTKGFKDEEKA